MDREAKLLLARSKLSKFQKKKKEKDSIIEGSGVGEFSESNEIMASKVLTNDLVVNGESGDLNQQSITLNKSEEIPDPIRENDIHSPRGEETASEDMLSYFKSMYEKVSEENARFIDALATMKSYCEQLRVNNEDLQIKLAAFEQNQDYVKSSRVDDEFEQKRLQTWQNELDEREQSLMEREKIHTDSMQELMHDEAKLRKGQEWLQLQQDEFRKEQNDLARKTLRSQEEFELMHTRAVQDLEVAEALIAQKDTEIRDLQEKLNSLKFSKYEEFESQLDEFKNQKEQFEEEKFEFEKYKDAVDHNKSPPEDLQTWIDYYSGKCEELEKRNESAMQEIDHYRALAGELDAANDTVSLLKIQLAEKSKELEYFRQQNQQTQIHDVVEELKMEVQDLRKTMVNTGNNQNSLNGLVNIVSELTRLRSTNQGQIIFCCNMLLSRLSNLLKLIINNSMEDKKNLKPRIC
jgi:chromosome segregation ATPase